MQHSFLLNSHRRSIKLSPPFPGQEPGDVPPIPVPPYPQQSPLGRKAEPCLWVFRCARPKASRDCQSLYPHRWVYLIKSRNRPFEQIRRNQHHRGKVLFTVPFAFLHSVRQQKALPGRMNAPVNPPGEAGHKARLVVISLPYRLGDGIFRCRRDSDPHLRLRMETVVAVRAFQKELYNTFFR